MVLRFKSGLRKGLLSLTPGCWHTAFFQEKDCCCVVSFVRRSYYEEIRSPPDNSVVFQAPEYRKFVDVEEIRERIAGAIKNEDRRVP